MKDRKPIELKRISVVGLGKLGAPLAACFAWKGFPTFGVDADLDKIEKVNQGITPIYEPGLQDLIQRSQGRLRGTEDYERAVLNSEITFIVVPTPNESEGGFSLNFVLQAGEKIGQALQRKKGYHLVVLTSTVMPGSTEGKLKPLLETASGKRCGHDFGLCYSPEFVALGSVIRDFLNPDFFLIGESDPASGEVLKSLYKMVCENNPPVARMNFINAEITKLAVNTFVTTKITYANMLARVCEQLPGANVDVVTSALGLDSRIGRKYLKGAIGYGGPCFPRDNLALAALARQVEVIPTLAEATDQTNRREVSHLAELLKSKLLPGGIVGILGLAYKPNSDVVEESQGLLLAQLLTKSHIPVVVYDPAAMENARRALAGSVKFAKSVEECIQASDALAITTPWEEFSRLTPKQLERYSRQRVLVDCWRLLDPLEYRNVTDYIPLGIGMTNSASRNPNQ